MCQQCLYISHPASPTFQRTGVCLLLSRLLLPYKRHLQCTATRCDDERTDWERRSLARWAHGLSAVEPKTYHNEESISEPKTCNNEESVSEGSSVDRGSQNFLESREVPVPADSTYAREDAKGAFKVSDDGPDVEPDGILVHEAVIDIRAIMDGWGKIHRGESRDQVEGVIDRHVTPPIESVLQTVN